MSGYFSNLSQFNEYLVTIQAKTVGNVGAGKSVTETPVYGLLDNEEMDFTTGMNLTNSAVGDAESFGKGAAGEVLGRVPGVGGYAKAKLKDSFSTVASTIKSYGDSSETPFSLGFHVFKSQLGNKTTYSDIIKTLTSYTQPTVNSTGIMTSSLYDPSIIKDSLDPRKIGDLVDKFDQGLIHVSIGSWFAATGLFCTGVTWSMSKFVDEEGSPIYMKVNFNFVPYKTLTASEISGWFLS